MTGRRAVLRCNYRHPLKLRITASARASAEFNIAQSCRADRFDWDLLRQETDNVGYPILPLAHQLVGMCGDAGGYLHWGATTQDIMGTANVLEVRAALTLVESDLVELRGILQSLAQRHRDTPMTEQKVMSEELFSQLSPSTAGRLRLFVLGDAMAFRRYPGRLAAQRREVLKLTGMDINNPLPAATQVIVALDSVQRHFCLECRRVVATGSSAHLSAPDHWLCPRPTEQLIYFAACSEFRNRLFVLDAAMHALDARTTDQLGARDLTAFHYRVLAPAGWERRVIGRDWDALFALPWILTPPNSAHHHLLAPLIAQHGSAPARTALVDQESSMLDLIKSGVGLSLVRDSVAMRESQSHGLVIADRVQLPCTLRLVWLRKRARHPVVAQALRACARVWDHDVH